jgi:hypothetical protein
MVLIVGRKSKHITFGKLSYVYLQVTYNNEYFSYKRGSTLYLFLKKET